MKPPLSGAFKSRLNGASNRRRCRSTIFVLHEWNWGWTSFNNLKQRRCQIQKSCEIPVWSLLFDFCKK